MCFYDLLWAPSSSFQVGALDEQQQQNADASQQLEASTVSLVPEDTTATISQLIELDLLADKDKKKTDDDSEEEVRERSAPVFLFHLIIRGV